MSDISIKHSSLKHSKLNISYLISHTYSHHRHVPPWRISQIDTDFSPHGVRFVTERTQRTTEHLTINHVSRFSGLIINHYSHSFEARHPEWSEAECEDLVHLHCRLFNVVFHCLRLPRSTSLHSQ
ncbi:MAG: hypothetical protein R6U95_05290 [Bacteroidales bacterium]